MEYYRQVALLETPSHASSDDDEYLGKVQDILSAFPCIGVPREPSKIMSSVFLGSSSNAENLSLLRSLKISYVLNCAGGNPVAFRRIREFYQPEENILGYDELPLEDDDLFDIRQYFVRAHSFIDYARGTNCNVLIHCPGVSRSGAIAISYLISTGQPLLEAVRVVKNCRRVALCNTSFMRQLIGYAREHGMLGAEAAGLVKSRGRHQIEQYRVKRAHLPLFL